LTQGAETKIKGVKRRTCRAGKSQRETKARFIHWKGKEPQSARGRSFFERLAQEEKKFSGRQREGIVVRGTRMRWNKEDV